MRVVFICAAFAICFDPLLPAFAAQCAGCGCEVRNENGSRNGVNGDGTATTLEDGCGSSVPAAWPDIAHVDVGRAASTAVDWLRRAWNGGIRLRLNVLKDAKNETLVNVRFEDAHSAAGRDGVGRTFGIRRRMQLFLLLPISFKLGIIMTLLMVLTAMSLKTLIIGFVILLLLLSHTHGHAKLWGASKVHEVSDLHKNIHIHVHTMPENHHSHVQSWHDPGSQPVIYSA